MKYVEATQFKEAIMDTRSLLFSGIAVRAAVFCATPAVADEGTITAKFALVGTSLQINPVGKSGDYYFNV